MKPSVDRLLFLAASSFGSAEDRDAFLDYACQGDRSLRSMIEDLLEVQRDADEFFEHQPDLKEHPASNDAKDEGIGARIGPYRLIERLGAGGCGVVYLAEQSEPVKRKVALKVIRVGMDTESVIARFVMERESLAMMDHPNIARVLDAGMTASGRPYFLMELVDGERITDFCDQRRLGIRARLELFVRVCEAIQHAHQKGVIHRDIKPSNILVQDHDGHPFPKIIDFGIAKATSVEIEGEATFTRSGQLLGTPSYMSPEQAEGCSDIDTRSDIYSLGALLCELLTGTPPFAPQEFEGQGAEQIRGMLRHHETGVPSARLKSTTSDRIGVVADQRAVEPSRLPSLLAGDLDWIVMKSIDKDRNRRYGTANALAMDVQRYLNEEPILARPPSRRYLLMKLVKRNRILFAAGGISLFGLVAGFGTSTWLFLREREAKVAQAALHQVAEQARILAEEARANEQRLFKKSQAVDQVAQAAVLQRYNELDEADKLLAEFNANDVPATLEAANALTRSANFNLSKQRWKDAAQRFFVLAHVIASVDPTDTNVNSQEWLPIAPAVLEWGERGQYRKLRALAIQRFSSSTNPVVAEHLLKLTLLEPADDETLRAVEPQAQVIRNSFEGPNKQTDPHLVAWGRCVLALLAYRQGNLDTAEELARLSLKNSAEPGRNNWNKIILTMIDLKKHKRSAEHRKTLADVYDQVRKWEEVPLNLEAGGRLAWSNWGSVRILMREANAILDP